MKKRRLISLELVIVLNMQVTRAYEHLWIIKSYWKSTKYQDQSWGL